MIIFIPLAIIFLLYSYIYFNVTSIVTDIIIYMLMFAVVIVSFLLGKKIKNDIHIQEKNALLHEIYELENKLSHEKDEKKQNVYLHRIKVIKDDIKLNYEKEEQ